MYEYDTQTYVYLKSNLMEIIHDLNYETLAFDKEQKVLLVEKPLQPLRLRKLLNLNYPAK